MTARKTTRRMYTAWSMVNGFMIPQFSVVPLTPLPRVFSPLTLSNQPILSSSSSSYVLCRMETTPRPPQPLTRIRIHHLLHPARFSMSHHPLLRFLFCFAFYALFLSCTICDVDSSYQFCDQNAQCGDTQIRFPFGIKGDRYACGDPNFGLFCLDDRLPLLPIGTNNYSILHASKVGDFNNDRRITIVNTKSSAESYCNPLAYSIDSWNSSYFRIDDQYRNRTFLTDCPRLKISSSIVKLNCSDWYYEQLNVSQYPETFGCEELAQVPIPKDHDHPTTLGNLDFLQDGFEVIWSYYDENRNRTCNGCLSNGGICGYNISNGDFLCHCKDGRRSNKCYNDRSNKNKTIPAIGGSIGAALLIAAVLLLLLIVYKLNKCPPKRDMQHNLGLKAVNSRTSVSKVEKFLEDYAREMPTRYSYFQLKRITNNFSFKLGEGGFGVVYRGTLSDGTLVAAKLLDQSRHGEKQFMNEVGTIGRIHHVHLVRLLGFCFEGSRSALLYEYMPNGSLEKFIFPGYKDTSHTLNWERLYSIALGAARGIAYLHTDCQKRIIHLDIKPHNVLLDENLSPKVSDFGLAKLYGRGDDHISVTAARGTPGYAAPEMWSRNFGPVTDKSDVYSFGMLLLEMVGGRKNIDVRLGASNSQFYFPEWIFRHLDGGELRRLRGISSGSEEEEERAMRMSKVGLWCIQSKPSDRPSMSRVVQMLEGNGNDISNPPLPFDMPSTAPEAPLLSASTPTPVEYSSSDEIKIEEMR